MSDDPGSLVMDTAIAQELNNAETRLLLDTIDSLRDLRIGGILDLPQFILVGDEHSGKSSILHAIFGIHFPVNDDIYS